MLFEDLLGFLGRLITEGYTHDFDTPVDLVVVGPVVAHHERSHYGADKEQRSYDPPPPPALSAPSLFSTVGQVGLVSVSPV